MEGRSPLSAPAAFPSQPGQQSAYSADIHTRRNTLVEPASIAETALGKRKQRDDGPLQTQIGNALHAPFSSSNSIHPGTSADSLANTNHVYSRLSSLQIASHGQQQQQPDTSSSLQSVHAHNGNHVVGNNAEGGPRHLYGMNCHALPQLGGTLHVNSSANNGNVAPPLDSTGPTISVQRTRDYGNGQIAANTAFPSPAASNTGQGGSTMYSDRQPSRPDRMNNTGFSGQQNVVLPGPSRTPTQQLPGAHDANRLVPAQAQIRQGRQCPEIYTPQLCLPQIDEFVAKNQATMGADRVVQQRINLLRDAVVRGDLLFLALHQVMCLRSSKPQDVPFTIQITPKVGPGFARLDAILSPTQELHADFVKWGAKFPASVGFIARNCAYEFAGLLQKCKAILEGLALRWDGVQQNCQERRCPPTVHELVRNFDVTSPILQLVIFLAIMRTFWSPHQSPWINEAQNAFKQRQTQHTQQSRTSNRQSTDDRIFINELQNHFTAHEQSNQPAYTAQQAALPIPAPNQQVWIQVPLTINSPSTAPALPYFSGAPQLAPQAAPVYPQGQFLPGRAAPVPFYPGAPVPYFPRATMPQLLPHAPQQSQSTTPVSTSDRPPRRRRNLSSPSVHSQQSASSTRRSSSHFFPAPGEIRPQPARVDPNVSALHQSHLRSPILLRSSRPEMGKSERLYQFVTGIASRRILNYTLREDKETFRVSEDMFASLPQVNRDTNADPSRAINESSHLLRLRCVKLADATAIDDDNALIKAETCWPKHTFFEVNDRMLELRKKLQWNKDLPVDITNLVRAGENSFRCVWSVGPTYKDTTTYAVAIEVISIQSHDTIKEECRMTRNLASEGIRESIKRSLGSVGDDDNEEGHNHDSQDDDDDLAIVDSTLTIGLCDPFMTNRVCKTPVRSDACLHRECFDLDTFLTTRPSPRDSPRFSVIDEWRCPICLADARPPRLHVDGFLSGVRLQLQLEGQLETTKAIVVDKFGKWGRKEERVFGGGAAAGAAAAGAAAGAAAAAGSGIGGAEKGKKKQQEVIEID
ncbi:MAG: hypothetical protein M1821_001165 [Bathelium mastoideum]|nr:MAG: hypothetical protein M1821_001165 [Bathelium mastoideum]